MLSSSFDISEFIEKVKDHSFQEIIWITDQEAVAAERHLYKINVEGERDKIVSYAGCLKNFILYMRHGVRTKDTRNLNLDVFGSIRREH